MDSGHVSNEANLSYENLVSTCRDKDLGVVRTGGEFRLIAVQAFSPGDLLFRIEGKRTHRPTRYSVQIGKDLHIDLGANHTTEETLDRFFWRFMNHSCAPNTIIRGQDVIAWREVDPWESVTFNYNTTEWCMAEPFTCRCGHDECLGTIQGFKHLTDQQRTLLRDFVAPHLECWLPKEAPKRGRSPVA